MTNNPKGKSCVCMRVLKALGVAGALVGVVAGIDQLYVNHSRSDDDEPRRNASAPTLTARDVFEQNRISQCFFNFGGVMNVSLPSEKHPPGLEPQSGADKDQEAPLVDVQVDSVLAMDDLIVQMTAAYNRRDFVAATNHAAKAEEIYLALTKPYVGKTVTVVSNLVANLVFLYSFRAEEALANKDYDKALQLANEASDLSVRDPWPRHEALRAVIVMRKGMHDMHTRVYTGKLPVLRWIKNVPRKQYEYWDCLASWGYLLPVEIDYKNLSYRDFVRQLFETNFPARLHYPSRMSFITKFPDAEKSIRSDVCFDRWLGFDRFEKFNLSEHVRRCLYDHYEEKGVQLLTPGAIQNVR